MRLSEWAADINVIKAFTSLVTAFTPAAMGVAVTRVGGRVVGTPMLRTQSLMTYADRPDRFAAALDAQPLSAWGADFKHLPALDRMLASRSGDDAARSRNILQNYIRKQGLWTHILDGHYDHRNDDLAQRLFSGYLQLMRTRDGEALSQRIAQDHTYFMSGAQFGMSAGYSKAMVALADTAQNHNEIFHEWSDADVMSFCRPLMCEGKTPSLYGYRELRFLNGTLLSRYAQGMMRDAGNLSYAFKMLDTLPNLREFRHVRVAMFDAMARAVQSGVPMTFPKGDKVQRAKQRELIKLLSAESPWHALGARMITLREPARSKNPLANLLDIDLARDPSQFIGLRRADLLAGVQSGMRTVLRGKKKGACAYVTECVKALYSHAVMVDQRDGTMSDTLSIAFSAAARQPGEKCAVRGMVCNPFNTLSAAISHDPIVTIGDRMLVDSANAGLSHTRPDPVIGRMTGAQIIRTAATLTL